MATFDTLPSEIRIEIYRHLFAGSRLKYVSYIPRRFRQRRQVVWHDQRREWEPLDAPSHAPIIAMLFVSRKTLCEARPVLIESVKINVTQLAQLNWPTHPLNTNFKVGDILQHVVFDLWTCHGYCTRTTCCWDQQLLGCLSKLPVLRSVTIKLSPGPASLFFRIVFTKAQEYKATKAALEAAAEDGSGVIIIGHDCQSRAIRAVARAYSRRGCSFALKTQAAVRVLYGNDCQVTDDLVVRICDLIELSNALTEC